VRIPAKPLVISLLALVALQACGKGGTDNASTANDTAAPAASAPATASGGAVAQSGRDYVYIVGSSTVYPFATVVAERFGRGSEFKTPKVESTGSGGGIKLFCDGVGVDYPDIANSSRAIKQSEVDSCAENGVTEIIEVKVGYDGIVVANAIGGEVVDLSRADIFMALAKEVPGEAAGELIENPH
jgi:phosphate transport system substrate-binding protein